MISRQLGSTVGLGVLVLAVGCGSSSDAESSGAPGSGPDPTTFGAEQSSGPDGTSSSGGATAPGVDAGGSDGGVAQCVGAAEDPSAAATVSGFLDKLPSNKPTGTARAQIIDAIIKSCHVFGPPTAKNPGWQRQHCWAHLASAIHKESSYSATANVKDSYATRSIGAAKANDPTVGLLQIRFSSTVHDYVKLGPIDSLSCVGCNFPASFTSHKTEAGSSSFWAVTGPTQNLSFMQSAACNIGLGAWYYYVYATANGKATATTQLDSYCSGQGAAGNLITGLLSHLKGPDGGHGVISTMAGVSALQGSDAGAYGYVTGIKTLFDGMIATPSGTTHPFFVSLAPNAPQYCD